MEEIAGRAISNIRRGYLHKRDAVWYSLLYCNSRPTYDRKSIVRNIYKETFIADAKQHNILHPNNAIKFIRARGFACVFSLKQFRKQYTNHDDINFHWTLNSFIECTLFVRLGVISFVPLSVVCRVPTPTEDGIFLAIYVRTLCR